MRTAGVNFRTRSEVGNGRNRAGVILLYVVDDDVLDTGRIDHLADTLDKFAGESRFAGIDKGHLLVHDKVGVVRGTAIRRVSVEVTLVPIDAAHPVHVGFTFTACSMAAPIVRRPSPDGEGLSSLG